MKRYGWLLGVLIAVIFIVNAVQAEESKTTTDSKAPVDMKGMHHGSEGGLLDDLMGDDLMGNDMMGGGMKGQGMMAARMKGMKAHMMGSMMGAKAQMVSSTDGGVIILNNGKLQKYDKDLNLVKEVVVEPATGPGGKDCPMMQNMMGAPDATTTATRKSNYPAAN